MDFEKWNPLNRKIKEFGPPKYPEELAQGFSAFMYEGRGLYWNSLDIAKTLRLGEVKHLEMYHAVRQMCEFGDSPRITGYEFLEGFGSVDFGPEEATYARTSTRNNQLYIGLTGVEPNNAGFSLTDNEFIFRAFPGGVNSLNEAHRKMFFWMDTIPKQLPTPEGKPIYVGRNSQKELAYIEVGIIRYSGRQHQLFGMTDYRPPGHQTPGMTPNSPNLAWQQT